MVPALRPIMSLSTGPTLFLASGPTSWHARDFLNTSAPSLGSPSCATAAPATPNAAVAAMTPRRKVRPIRPVMNSLLHNSPSRRAKPSRPAGRSHATVGSSAAALRATDGGAGRTAIYHDDASRGEHGR